MGAAALTDRCREFLQTLRLKHALFGGLEVEQRRDVFPAVYRVEGIDAAGWFAGSVCLRPGLSFGIPVVLTVMEVFDGGMPGDGERSSRIAEGEFVVPNTRDVIAPSVAPEKIRSS